MFRDFESKLYSHLNGNTEYARLARYKIAQMKNDRLVCVVFGAKTNAVAIDLKAF